MIDRNLHEVTVTGPMTELTTDPATDPATELTTDPATDPEIELTTDSATEPEATDPEAAGAESAELEGVSAHRRFAVFPTLCTLGNALCGFAAIFYASRAGVIMESNGGGPVGMPMGWTPLTVSAAFVFVGMVFDGLDGRIARLTNSASELGEQLDSMADMVTFGVAPAFITVQLVIGSNMPFLSAEGDVLLNRGALVIAGLYVACAALRLARFNLENMSKEVSGEIRHHMAFAGLPSPGAGGTVVSLVILHQYFLAQHAEGWAASAASVGLMAIMLLCAIAMVSRMRYVHVLNRYVRGQAPLWYVVVGVAIVGLLILRLQISLATAFVIYALSGPAGLLLETLRRKSAVIADEVSSGKPRKS